MTKISSLENPFRRVQAILNLSLVVLLSLQPSAEAFLGSLQMNPVHSTGILNSVAPSEEMSSISDKSLLQSALLPLSDSAAAVSPMLVSLNRSAVSISTYKNSYRQIARFVFAASALDGSRKYQAYEMSPEGVLGRVIEIGSLRGGEFIRERIYDYKNGTVVLYNPDNVFEKRIYELRPFGEAGRPVQYRGRTQSGDLVNIRFFYAADRVICVHMKNMTFSVYEFSKGLLGNLLEVGTARAILPDGQIDSSQRIAISEINRNGEVIPVYVFHAANGTEVIRERIGGNPYTMGAMGRVLRFMSSTADLEYFYSEAMNGEAAKVRVLNHLLGESLTFEVKGKDLAEDSGRLTDKNDSLRVPFIKAVFNSFPLFFKDSGGMVGMASESKSLPIYIRLNDEVLIWEKLLRGPPAIDRAQFKSSLSLSFVSFLSSFLSVSLIPFPYNVIFAGVPS